MKKISICIPCYNEEANINECYERVKKALSQLQQYDYEILFADNASNDSSQDRIRHIAQSDTRVKAIFNQANFGPQRSLTNLHSRCSGNVIVGVPCDLQEPPEMIPAFIKEWEKGFDIVWGKKVKSEEARIKYFLRTCYYRIINILSDKPQLEHVTGFGAISAWVIQRRLDVNDPYVALRHQVIEWGCNIKLIPYTQMKRKEGKSSYNISRYLTFAIDSMINTSFVPLRMATVAGTIMSILSFVVGIGYFIYKLLHWNQFSLGMAPMIIGMFMMASIQLLTLGVIGEYVGAIFRKLKNDNRVIEKELINFNIDQTNGAK